MADGPEILGKKGYKKELHRLQVELVRLQEWIVHEGLKVVVIFEGRDTAGKGGTIRRITEKTNPRVIHDVALGTPNDREKTQWYFQRYVAQLPAAGEMILFDRSWYNRAGVERVMGFCTDEEYEEFMHSCPRFERIIQRSGIVLIKYWLSVSDDEQERRFQARLDNPLKRWKLSPDRPRGARPLGRLRRGQGRDVRPHRHRGLTLVRGRVRRQALDPAQPDQPPARTDPLPAGRPGAGEAAAAPAARLRAAAEVDRETGAGAVSSRGSAAGLRGRGAGSAGAAARARRAAAAPP